MSNRFSQRRQRSLVQRDRTVTTLEQAPDAPFLVPTPTVEPASSFHPKQQCSTLTTAVTPAIPNPGGSVFPHQLSFSATPFSFAFSPEQSMHPFNQQQFSPFYNNNLAEQQQQQQQQEQEVQRQQGLYIGQRQANTFGPSANHDLQLLEHLKESIKSGQHALFRPIPNPEALASIYLGPRQPQASASVSVPEPSQNFSSSSEANLPPSSSSIAEQNSIQETLISPSEPQVPSETSQPSQQAENKTNSHVIAVTDLPSAPQSSLEKQSPPAPVNNSTSRPSFSTPPTSSTVPSAPLTSSTTPVPLVDVEGMQPPSPDSIHAVPAAAARKLDPHLHPSSGVGAPEHTTRPRSLQARITSPPPMMPNGTPMLVAREEVPALALRVESEKDRLDRERKEREREQREREERRAREWREEEVRKQAARQEATRKYTAQRDVLSRALSRSPPRRVHHEIHLTGPPSISRDYADEEIAHDSRASSLVDVRLPVRIRDERVPPPPAIREHSNDSMDHPERRFHIVDERRVPLDDRRMDVEDRYRRLLVEDRRAPPIGERRPIYDDRRAPTDRTHLPLVSDDRKSSVDDRRPVEYHRPTAHPDDRHLPPPAFVEDRRPVYEDHRVPIDRICTPTEERRLFHEDRRAPIDYTHPRYDGDRRALIDHTRASLPSINRETEDRRAPIDRTRPPPFARETEDRRQIVDRTVEVRRISMESQRSLLEERQPALEERHSANMGAKRVVSSPPTTTSATSMNGNVRAQQMEDIQSVGQKGEQHVTNSREKQMSEDPGWSAPPTALDVSTPAKSPTSPSVVNLSSFGPVSGSESLVEPPRLVPVANDSPVADTIIATLSIEPQSSHRSAPPQIEEKSSNGISLKERLSEPVLASQVVSEKSLAQRMSINIPPAPVSRRSSLSSAHQYQDASHPLTTGHGNQFTAAIQPKAEPRSPTIRASPPKPAADLRGHQSSTSAHTPAQESSQALPLYAPKESNPNGSRQPHARDDSIPRSISSHTTTPNTPNPSLQSRISHSSRDSLPPRPPPSADRSYRSEVERIPVSTRPEPMAVDRRPRYNDAPSTHTSHRRTASPPPHRTSGYHHHSHYHSPDVPPRATSPPIYRDIRHAPAAPAPPPVRRDWEYDLRSARAPPSPLLIDDRGRRELWDRIPEPLPRTISHDGRYLQEVDLPPSRAREADWDTRDRRPLAHSTIHHRDGQGLYDGHRRHTTYPTPPEHDHYGLSRGRYDTAPGVLPAPGRVRPRSPSPLPYSRHASLIEDMRAPPAKRMRDEAYDVEYYAPVRREISPPPLLHAGSGRDYSMRDAGLPIGSYYDRVPARDYAPPSQGYPSRAPPSVDVYDRRPPTPDYHRRGPPEYERGRDGRYALPPSR